ncbi:pentapeptide repeat-containing protein [Salipiger sp. CCB-MM3]|uniref:pentapeptide repeat-containing protein n=1 Tax=Salipiger sp. CCB-MM3 TaxID=1792508 RepID=UPI0012F9B53E|nr:pentapeptide repeat-containing protein [Salipiger sp. CCB-MM3]
MKNGSGAKFLEWVGLRRQPDFSKAPWLGALVGVFLALLIISATVGVAAILAQSLAIVLKFGADAEAIRNVGLVLVAIFGAPFVVWRATVAQKQADTAEQSHITDQINKAVAGLGSERATNKIGRPVKIYTGKSHEVVHLVEKPSEFELPPRSREIKRYRDETWLHGNDVDEDEVFDGLHIKVKTWENVRTVIEWQGREVEPGDDEAIADVGDWAVFAETLPNIEVRTGAIYALERISQDSERDHIQIMEILTAYIRENAPVKDLVSSEKISKLPFVRTDIQAAIDVIARRSSRRISLEHAKKYRLDLQSVDLSGARFCDGDFTGAIFSLSRLECANFRDAKLVGSWFHGSLLNYCSFLRADLTGAVIDGAEISQMAGSDLSIFLANSTRGLSMARANISAIDYLPTDDQYTPTLGSKDTKLGSDLESEYSCLVDEMRQFGRHKISRKEMSEEGMEKLRVSGFLYWSPYKGSDWATSRLRHEMRKELRQTGFPFE